MNAPNKNSSKLPDLKELIKARNWSGASTLLQHELESSDMNSEEYLNTLHWYGYCTFHLGDYMKAGEVYQQLIEKVDNPQLFLDLACCYYKLNQFNEAREVASNGQECSLKTRLLFSVSTLLDESSQQNVTFDDLESQLTMAAMHVRKGRYDDALAIYKGILLDNRNLTGVFIPAAICYFKLGYSDVASDMIRIYLQRVPDSLTAINLRACVDFKLFGARAALDDMEELLVHQATHPTVLNNVAVFRGGKKGQQVWSGIKHNSVEARVNLAIVLVRQGAIEEAHNVLTQFSTVFDQYVPAFQLVKSSVLSSLGQQKQESQLLETARNEFHALGSSKRVANTVIGRQSMASYHILTGNFGQAVRFLRSIESYCSGEQGFHANYGIALGACAQFTEAVEHLEKCDEPPKLWYARCLIQVDRADDAWKIYENNSGDMTPKEVTTMLLLLGNDCFTAGHFLESAKAFSVLLAQDDSHDNWTAFRAAIAGAFRKIVYSEMQPKYLGVIVALLEGSRKPKALSMANSMRDWAETAA
ncbi:hypothetical protein PCE1_004522 [Barthelona sp. PCE]